MYEPIWGYIYDTTVVRRTESRAVCGIGRYAEPRIELEIVVYFASTPTAGRDVGALLASLD